MSTRLHVVMLGQFETAVAADAPPEEERHALPPLPAPASAQSRSAPLRARRQVASARAHLAELYWSGRPPPQTRGELAALLSTLVTVSAGVDHKEETKT